MLALVTTLLAVATSEPAQAAWSKPNYVRSIGGRGEAGVYAWGIQYNPVSDEILVGDYWNFVIRRYDRTTGVEIDAFYRPASQRVGQPYSLAVNQSTGDIFVPEISDAGTRGIVAVYDKAGNYKYEISSGARYNAWIATDSAGYLYIADSHYWNNAGDPPKIRKFSVGQGQCGSKNACEVASWGSYGTGPGQIGRLNGLAFDADNNLYAADVNNQRIHKYASSGASLIDFGSSGNGIGQFTGDLRGMTVDDANGFVYVADSEAGEIEQFTTAGVPVTHFGSTGTGPGQYADGARQIDVDSTGELWTADYGNYRMLVWGPSGTLDRTYPDPPRPPSPGGFSQVRDVAATPSGEAYGADSWNNRIQKFGADGSFLGTWGQRSSHPPYGMDYPRGVMVSPSTGDVWVANTRDHKIRVYDPAMNHKFSLGVDDASTPGNFRWPMDLEYWDNQTPNDPADDKVVVGDYVSGVVKILGASDGVELEQFKRSNSAVDVNPADGHIFVLNWDTDRVYEYARSTRSWTLVRDWGGTGSGDGKFQNPWDLDIIGGYVYVTDAQLNRVQVFTTTGAFVGKWGATGAGPGQFNNLSGIDHDASGNIYLADAGNDRIQVFSLTQPAPMGDTTRPSVAIAAPANKATLPAETAHISGSVSDDAQIGTVEVAVQDSVSKKWWNAKLSNWSTIKAWNLAIVTGASLTSASYDFPFNGVDYSGSYFAQARATDAAGNRIASGFPTTKFGVVASSSTDTVEPDTTITYPLRNQANVPDPVTIAGGASDNVAVAGVDVAVQDSVSKQWWNAATSTWGPAQKWAPATLAGPGAATTNWTNTFDSAASGGSGSYYVVARARDTSSNMDSTKPSTRFTM